MNDPSRVNERLIPIRIVGSVAFLDRLGEELAEAVELFLSEQAHFCRGDVDTNDPSALTSKRAIQACLFGFVAGEPETPSDCNPEGFLFGLRSVCPSGGESTTSERVIKTAVTSPDPGVGVLDIQKASSTLGSIS